MKRTKRKSTAAAKRMPAKRTVPAKQYRTTPAKQKHTVPAKRTVPAREYRKAPPKRRSPIPAHDATADIPNGNAWSMSVEAGDIAHIADNVTLYAVVQNRGPGIVGVPWREGALQKIVPGGVWAMPIVGAFSVENVSSASAVVQIQFLPKFK